MGELENIGNYSETFEYLQEQVVYFENNLKNPIFDQDDGEDDRTAYRRGESVYDRLHESLVSIKDILTKKNEIVEFLFYSFSLQFDSFFLLVFVLFLSLFVDIIFLLFFFLLLLLSSLL